MKAALLRLMVNVPDEQVPGLRAQILHSLRLNVLMTVPILLCFPLIQSLFGPVHLMRTLVGHALMVLLCLAWAWYLQRCPERLLAPLHTAYVTVMGLNLSLFGWYMMSDENPFQGEALLVILLMALVCPIEPRWHVLLGFVVTVGELMIAGVFLSSLSIGTMTGTVLVGVGSTLFAVGSVQVARHNWLEKEQAHKQLLLSDRLATLGRNTASIAHELKTPLASAKHELYGLDALVDELSQSVGHPEVTTEDLREIILELKQHKSHLKERLERITTFVTDLRQHTQQAHHTAEISFVLGDRVKAVLRLLDHQLGKVKVECSFQDQGVVLFGDPTKLDQVLINLVNNALEAHPEPGRMVLKLESWNTDTHAMFAIEDNGPGIPEDLHEQVFHSMFTTKGEDGGTGLGLAVCRTVMEGLFGGQLGLVPCDQGARFELGVPHVRGLQRPSSKPVAQSMIL